MPKGHHPARAILGRTLRSCVSLLGHLLVPPCSRLAYCSQNQVSTKIRNKQEHWRRRLFDQIQGSRNEGVFLQAPAKVAARALDMAKEWPRAQTRSQSAL